MSSIEKKKFSTNELLVKPSGRSDINLTPELEKEVNSEIESISYLTIDMSEVDYISSVGLRALLSFQKQISSRGEMKIVDVKPEVLEIFKMVGFDRVLNIV
jgi:anti-sigma B factor antagonist